MLVNTFLRLCVCTRDVWYSVVLRLQLEAFHLLCLLARFVYEIEG